MEDFDWFVFNTINTKHSFEFTTLFNDVSGINTNITTFFNDVSGNTVNITTLQTKLTTDEANISTLFNDVSGNTYNLNTLSSDVSNNYLLITTAQSTYALNTSLTNYALSNNSVLTGQTNISEIIENIYYASSGSTLSLSYTNIKSIVYYTPTANFTLNLTSIPVSINTTISITLIYNSKFYSNYVGINGSGYAPIAGGGLSNIAINSSATYVMQQVNICFLNSTIPTVITNVLSLF